MTRQIVVDIVGDASKFNKATDQAVTKAEGLGGKLKGVGKGMVIGAGIGAFGLLSGAIDTAIGKLGEAAEAFREDQRGQALLAQALKNNIPNWDGNTKGAEEYAAAQGKLGFADDEIRASLGQLIGVTHDLTEAQELNTLAQDLARAKGIDLASATDAITKAANGNGRALKAMGIDLAGATDAAGILDAVQKNVAGSAETWAATNEGKLAVSNVKVGEAMEKVGGVVDQLTQAVMPVFADVLMVVVDVLGEIWSAIQPIVSALWDALQPALKKVGPLAEHIFGTIKIAVKALTPVFKEVFRIIGGMISAAVTVYSALFDTLIKVMGTLGDVFRGIGRIVGQVFGSIGGVIRGAINTVIGAVNAVIRAINRLEIHINLKPPIGPEINFDWNGLNLGTLPYLHSGGIVPGAPGSDVLAVLQAGEHVTPAGRSGATVIVNVAGSIIGASGIDELTDMIAYRLHLDGK